MMQSENVTHTHIYTHTQSQSVHLGNIKISTNHVQKEIINIKSIK